MNHRRARTYAVCAVKRDEDHSEPSPTWWVVGRATPASGMKKAPGRRVHDQGHQSAGSFPVDVYPSDIDLSSRALQHFSGLLAGHCRQIGSR